MAEIYQRVKRGNDLLVNLYMKPKDDIHLKDVLWDVEFFTKENGYRLTIKKVNAFMVDEDNYLCPVPTDMFEAGILNATLKTKRASDYFEDGYQDEIVDFQVDKIILY